MTTEPSPLPNSPGIVAPSAFRLGLGRFGFVLAFAGATALGLAAGDHLPGCGQGCSDLGQGAFSHIGGLSIAWLGAAVYLLCLLFQRGSLVGAFVRSTVVFAALGAFIAMQLTGHFCLWCSLVHLVAVAAVLVEPSTGSLARWWLVALPGLASVGLLAAVQMKQADNAPAQIVAAVSSALAPHTMRLHDGAFTLSTLDYPCLGSPDAKTMAVVISDYTCGHCYDLKKAFKEAAEKTRGKLGVLVLPASRGEDSRDIQRNMRALWLCDPLGYAVVDAQLVSGDLKAERPAVHDAVAKQLGGEDHLKAALAMHGASIDATLTKVEELLAANEKIVGTRNLPQYIAADKVYVGGTKDVDTLLAQALGQFFEDDHPLVFDAKEVNLGRVAAGTGTNYALVMKNRGKLPLRITTIEAPEGVSVGEVPMHPIWSGQSVTCLLHLTYPRKAKAFDWKVKVSLAEELGSREVHVKGETWAPWTLSAETFAITSAAPNGKATPSGSTLDIKLLEDLELSLPVPQLPHAKLKIERGADGKSWHLVATPEASLAPGTYSGELPIAVAAVKAGQALPDGWPPAFTVPYSVTVMERLSPLKPVIPNTLSATTR